MEEDCVESEKRRRDRFSEILECLLHEDDSIAAIARKFRREGTYVRRWLSRQGFPFLVDYISLCRILGFHNFDAFLEFMDGDYPAKDYPIHAEASYAFYLEKLAKTKRQQAQELEQESRFLTALMRHRNQKKVGRNPSPLRFKEHKMNNNVSLTYSECEKLGGLINASADERDIPPEEIFRRAKTSPTSKLHIQQPQYGTYYMEESQLERLLPYLFVVSCWSPFEFLRPLRSYSNVEELVESLRSDGAACYRGGEA